MVLIGKCPEWSVIKGKGVIYKYTLDTGLSYIGQTTVNLSRRNRDHCKIKKTSEPFVDRFLRKHDFTLEILCECDYEDLDNMENFYIFKYNTIYPNGYNILINDGGIKRPIIFLPKKYIVVYDLNGHFINQYNSYYNCGKDIGINPSNISRTIKNPNKIYCKKYIIRRYDISDDIPIDIQYIHSVKKYKTLPVEKYTLNHVFVERYDSVREASRMNNINPSCISHCCKGKICYSYGFIWEYENPLLKEKYKINRNFEPVCDKKTLAKKPMPKKTIYYIICPDGSKYIGDINSLSKYLPDGYNISTFQRKKCWYKKSKKGSLKGFEWGLVAACKST